MPDDEVREARVQVFKQMFDQIDRTMLAAGAADRAGDVAAIGAHQFAKRVAQKVPEIPAGLVGDRVLFQIIDHHAIIAVKGAQFGNPVWIWQIPDIKKKVAIQRDAMLEPERLKQNSRAGRITPDHPTGNIFPELMYGRVTGIDDQICLRAHGQ